MDTPYRHPLIRAAFALNVGGIAFSAHANVVGDGPHPVTVGWTLALLCLATYLTGDYFGLRLLAAAGAGITAIYVVAGASALWALASLASLAFWFALRWAPDTGRGSR